MIQYTCPTCGQAHTAPAESAGIKHACSQCGQRLQVPQRRTVPHPPLNKTRLGKLSGTDKTMLGKAEEPDDEPLDVLPADRPHNKRRRRRDSGRDHPDTCPECGGYLYERTSISDMGMILGIILLFVFFPLAIIGFFMQDTWLVCEDCGEKVRKVKSFGG
jgi:DNA-directed RNA polymerase subunit RPC12/RpoP